MMTPLFSNVYFYPRISIELKLIIFKKFQFNNYTIYRNPLKNLNALIRNPAGGKNISRVCQ